MNKKTVYTALVLSACVLSYVAAQQLYTAAQPRVVYVDMIADLFHAGHVNFLQQARQHGDYLIVGICSDEVSTNYKRRPILTMEERVQEVTACRYVDEVVTDSPLYLTQEFMNKYHIDVVVHGDDYSPEQVKAYYAPAVAQGKYATVPYTNGVSTSDIINRIRTRSDAELSKKHATTAAPAA